MPTNDERREVAARLREYEPRACVRGAIRWQLACEDVDCCEDCEKDTIRQLADLIEPEPERTCRNGATGSDFKCSECGCRVIGSAYWTEANICDGDWNFCPNCGARVKEGA